MFVKIEQWDCDPEKVHVYVKENRDDISSHHGALVRGTVTYVVAVGLVSGHLKDPGPGAWNLVIGGCNDFCRMCDLVLSYTDDEYALARHQMPAPVPASRIAVCTRDYLKREELADEARSVENPWEKS